MRLVEAATPTFARHETFHPRYGWFRKAYRAAAEDPSVFTGDDAPVRIGVGKNMVRSIRFWGLAAKLITEDPKPTSKRAVGVVPTRIGHALFGDGGWDPWMEDPGTLWLLHWLLLANPSRLPVWWLAFNDFNAVEFSESDLEAAAVSQLESTEWKQPHQSSLKKDVSALVRSYAPAQTSRRMQLDDMLDCPLRELGLIGRSVAASSYRFRLGPKPTLPAAILLYSALDYICRIQASGSTITIRRLAQELGAPGRAFKLTEREITTALESHLESLNHKNRTGSRVILNALHVSTPPPGDSQLTWSEDPAGIATAVLDQYFGTHKSSRDGAQRLAGSRALAGPQGDQAIDDNLLAELGVGREGSHLRMLDEAQRRHDLAEARSGGGHA